MERRLRTSLVALGLAILSVCALGIAYLTAPQAPKAPSPDLSLTQTTAKGLFRVALEPDPGALTVGAIHGWAVTVTRADGKPVTGATFSIDGGMPAHGHGLPTSPQVTAELGEGRYRLEGVKFSMDGLWALDIAVTTGADSDVAHFNLQI